MSKLFQFWQELKRRKVVRVITVYAAAAFVILELTDIVAPSLGLPDWTLNLIIILLVIGFIIAAILSWIYDIKPEGGFERTAPAQKVSEENKSSTSNSWKIASYISFVVIAGLIILHIVSPGSRHTEHTNLDKSIAVLPFRNDSSDEENNYFINGAMESILDKLCKIEDLRVPGRTSVEQYRNASKPVKEIAQEMKVSYILQGSGQKIGRRILLTVQLLDGKNDEHLWSKQYDREISRVEDLIDIQVEIARLVAGEIQAIITPEEEELIEKNTTLSFNAYDFYQRGREEYWKYHFENDTLALSKASEYFQRAIDNDSTFAQAYTGLAWINLDQEYINSYLSEDFLDSLYVLTEIALSYDDRLADAYTLRGIYYRDIDAERALEEYNRSLQLNPNDWITYQYKARLFWDNPVKVLENLYKAAEINRGHGFAELLYEISWQFFSYGHFELGLDYANQALALDADSAEYYWHLGIQFGFTKDVKWYNNLKQVLTKDENHLWGLYQMGEYLSFVGRHQESLVYFEKFLEIGGFFTHGIQRIAYSYWNNGNQERANYYFDLQVQYALTEIELGRYWATLQTSYYDLASISAFQGEKAEALDYLRNFSKAKTFQNWMISLIKNDPLFDNIRDEPEFQQIIGNMEAKYQAECERIRQWINEHDSVQSCLR